MSQCKPGDLAVIQGPEEWLCAPLVNGTIVVVGQSIGDGAFAISPVRIQYKDSSFLLNGIEGEYLKPIRPQPSTQKALDQHTPTHVA